MVDLGRSYLDIFKYPQAETLLLKAYQYYGVRRHELEKKLMDL